MGKKIKARSLTEADLRRLGNFIVLPASAFKRGQKKEEEAAAEAPPQESADDGKAGESVIG